MLAQSFIVLLLLLPAVSGKRVRHRRHVQAQALVSEKASGVCSGFKCKCLGPQPSSFLEDAEPKLEPKLCTDEGFAQFKQQFTLGLRSDGMIAEAHFGAVGQAGNVLFLYPGHDHNGAFNIGHFECARLVMWQNTPGINSVIVKRVNSTAAATAALAAYRPGSIDHLVIGGHGGGDLLVWGEGPGGMLEVNDKDATGFLEESGKRLKFGASVFLDSCLGATEHKAENLGAFVARTIGNTAPPGVHVWASVHSMSNRDLAVNIEGGKFEALVVHGSVKYQAKPQLPTSLAVGDWVRTHFKMSLPGASPSAYNMSQKTDAGVILKIREEKFLQANIAFGSVTGVRHILTVMHKQGAEQEIPMSWVSQSARAGEVVHLHVPSEDGSPPHKIHGVLMNVRLPEQPGGQPTALVQVPKDELMYVAVLDAVVPGFANYGINGIQGDRFPQLGDLLLAPFDTSGNVGLGVVFKKSQDGASVYFYAQKYGTTVNAGYIVTLIKPGARVRASVAIVQQVGIVQKTVQQLRLGRFDKADITGVTVTFDGIAQPIVVPSSMLIDASDGEHTLLRSTKEGCACKQSWQLMGSPTRCNNFCCNPNNAPDGDWCFTEDPACGTGEGYGTCNSDPSISFNSLSSN